MENEYIDPNFLRGLIKDYPAKWEAFKWTHCISPTGPLYAICPDCGLHRDNITDVCLKAYKGRLLN
jgi:hypothetical protein